MKLILLAFSLISFAYSAETQKCELTWYVAINGMTDIHMGGSQVRPVASRRGNVLPVHDAQTCFEFALKHSYGNSFYVQNIDLRFGSLYPIWSPTYVQWEFNDGIFDDTDGMVSKYTLKCLNNIHNTNVITEARKTNNDYKLLGSNLFYKDCTILDHM